MTGEVVSHGDDDRRRGPGRAVGVVVALALVWLGATALDRERDERERPDARPSPPVTGLPLPGETREDRTDPVEAHVTVPRPPPGVLRSVLLPEDVPGFLLPDDELPAAVAAVGGPDHAPVLVGWCEPTRTFTDAAGTVAYDEHGKALDGGLSLPTYTVRRNGADPLKLDIVDAGGRTGGLPADPPPAVERCPRPLRLPTLPGRAARVHDAVVAHRVVSGRYVVTTDTRAFCRLGRGPRCAADGWEVYRIGSLPPGDLAGGYTWEGSFLVRGRLNGTLSVVLLPGARLVRRERVGAAARVGLVRAVDREPGGGPYRVTFNAFRHVTGRPDDDSPPGPPPEEAPEWADLMGDLRGGTRTYVVRPDVAVFVGRGYSGPGQPRGSVRTLERFLESPANLRHAFWLVLDTRDRVLRVVAQPDG